MSSRSSEIEAESTPHEHALHVTETTLISLGAIAERFSVHPETQPRLLTVNNTIQLKSESKSLRLSN
jgi:hypothetical protein